MNAPNITIRPETVADYADIANLHVRAFNNRADVPAIVALQRQRRSFDPTLLLVAERNGRVLGHVMFMPEQIRLLGQTVPAVNLSPIAIEPACQRQGVGGLLIREGHTLAAAKGYKFSILLGHDTYYPRFGYHVRAYGPSQMAVAHSSPADDVLETRRPTSADMAALQELWWHEEGMVDMAIVPLPDLLDWLSPNPAIRAAVYLRDGEIVGYTRINEQQPAQPLVFLARDHAAARAMLATIAQQSPADEYVLPLHPASASAAAFGQAKPSAWNAAMACPLAPSPLDQYLAEVQAGQRAPGRVIWPTAFDLD